ncbi:MULTISPECIES: D-alanyl-D-alanine carboxypeptidase family protein [Desulfitobacterium]|uniref:D-alanyl-D-alanine carboxypeptidase n=1 Tax=Desulfitobacterium dehalogenans (strain ATCC 51507 / DSM 9161 / JW/IU-DC1) TaxID=756499 RepID=I4A9B5_DESDJ|nr:MULTISPECIES: D-alanyl-D-alanine carboxypeptidase family protein [Desulfitobacterium]AFM00550.1 D-alanyl-D-alanine carboxypeptidase [Desulfitobacterium dehalogenans ATCC 51507]
MKRIIALITLLLYFFIFVPTLSAAPETNQETAPPEISGEAAYLIDVQSGQTLYSKNGDQLMAPASTTKIMTGLLGIELGNPEDIVTASETMLDYNTVYGTRIYLEPGEQLSLEDMLYALLLNSANDAAVAIAEHISGNMPDFVSLMNQRAADLGLKHTTFKNPSGLNEEGHLTTAHDLARIAQAAYANPKFREYIKTKSHVIPREKENVPIEMINENKLLWRDDGITGMKTGYTSVAKNCLVASASRDGRDVIGVILKSPGREIYTDMQALLDYGFEQFENTLYKGIGDSLGQIEIQGQQINLLTDQALWITQKRDKALAQPRINVLPIRGELTDVAAGQVLTHLEVWEEEERLRVVPLAADRSIITETPVEKKSYALFTGLGLMVSGVVLYGAVQQRKHAERRRERAQQRKERNGQKIHYSRYQRR